MNKQLPKIYDPKEVEDRIYDFWLKGNYFHAEPNPDKKPYTIVIPPPNVTGQLHMGHAVDETYQDILIRWKRMQGYEALWVPGTDHAAIATEVKIVEAMAKEGLTKEGIGRDEFMVRAWQWKEEYGGKIIEQLKKLGSSCDWERERFTMDEGCSKAVKEVFNRLYEKGLIYRGERIINWCSSCETSLSDAEVEFEEQDSYFWHLKYPLANQEGYVSLATTRPETMLGDTAVAVNPNDDRYKDLIGKTVILPLLNREIPIIGDDYVDMEFGTGVVKITPAHDPNDFEVGARHNLPIINVMTEDARINKNGGKYEGLDRYECRKRIVEDLDKGGFLDKKEPHKHNVGKCYRCRTVVEPRVSMQWFVKMKELADPAIEVVKNGEIKFVPNRFAKIYYHWMENIRDWCISRQLWWGHQIPAWYCGDCGETMVSREEVKICSKCSSKNIEQDQDTLDTWFSSALWPFSTLGWPDNTPEYEYFYPTSTLVTAYDIIFFWVARMIFSGVEHTGMAPFNTVYIHGMMRDSQGRKMSKSLGNGIDPLDVIDIYGADALRFTLTSGNSPGNDMRYHEEKVASSRNFANKIWNAARYVLMNIDGEDIKFGLPENLSLEDKWIITEFNNAAREITINLEKFELGIAAQKVYDFIWDVFCDWYIELSKARIQLGGKEAAASKQTLVYIMSGAMRLLHPFMPFITEEIWQTLPHKGEALVISEWPEYDEAQVFESEAKRITSIMEAIKAVRNRRAEMNVPPSKKAKLYIEAANSQAFSEGIPFLKKLAFASEVEIGTNFNLPGAVSIVTADAKIFIPLDELVDLKAEKARLTKEKEDVEKRLKQSSSKLSNEAFMSKAPEQVVNKEKENVARYQEKLSMIEERLKEL